MPVEHVSLATIARGRARLASPHPTAVEIEHLPRDRCLLESGEFQIFCAPSGEVPVTLLEIGRLRESTFRSVGEGTGRTVDLDEFDQRYLHLFSWNRRRREVVGAYRIGRTDRIVESTGIEGLYTRTLFRYDERLIRRLAPALELGRSFVRVEYQRHPSALLLLWKGIGRFIVGHPEYRVLFGTVSISTRYSDSSHQLLMSFLEQNHLDASLAGLIEALNPCPLRAGARTRDVPDSVEAADRLVAKLEADGKGMPVLLRQYLKLNARLLGFNVDPAFGDALDALMMVDLTTVDRAILNRYLGREAADRFLRRHAACGRAA